MPEKECRAILGDGAKHAIESEPLGQINLVKKALLFEQQSCNNMPQERSFRSHNSWNLFKKAVFLEQQSASIKITKFNIESLLVNDVTTNNREWFSQQHQLWGLEFMIWDKIVVCSHRFLETIYRIWWTKTYLVWHLITRLLFKKHHFLVKIYKNWWTKDLSCGIQETLLSWKDLLNSCSTSMSHNMGSTPSQWWDEHRSDIHHTPHTSSPGSSNLISLKSSGNQTHDHPVTNSKCGSHHGLNACPAAVVN